MLLLRHAYVWLTLCYAEGAGPIGNGDQPSHPLYGFKAAEKYMAPTGRLRFFRLA